MASVIVNKDLKNRFKKTLQNMAPSFSKKRRYKKNIAYILQWFLKDHI